MKQVNLRISPTILTLLIGLFLSVSAYAQNITVKGHVKDATGLEVIGANVVEKGNSTNGTITDLNGNFTLSVPQGATLSVSFIGYKPVEVAAASTMMVTLQDDSQLLDAVVVIGYGTVKKNDMTGSVTAMKPDAINKGLTTNAQDMMTGKIAGVNVVSAGGTPGGGATIRIRGGASLTASSDPLIVIDGLAMDNNGVKGMSNPLSLVNPNDIESFTVLKDASATAIYGSRASNGVIIITTKKGTAGSRPRVSYSGNVSLGMVKNKMDVMDANEFRAYATALYPDKADILGAMGTANTNWQDQIYRTAVSHDHNLTVYGGLANMPYRVSLGYTNQDGILKTSNFERYTASINVSPSFLDKHLTMNINAKGMIAKNRYADGGAVGAAVSMDPTQSIYTDREEFGGYFQWSVPGKDLGDTNANRPCVNSLATKNPLAMLTQRDDRSTSKSFVGSAEFDYKIHGLEDLRLHLNLGGDFSTGQQDTETSPFSGTNNYYGLMRFDTEDKYNMSLSAYAQYSKDFKNQHFDVMGGYEWQHFHREGMYEQYGMYPSTNVQKPGQKYLPEGKAFKTESYLVSFFGRLNYSLFDRYLLTATVRNDGTSRFSKDNRWALFPSVALGWRVKEEAFLKDIDVLSDFKLRLGYGITGQQNITDNDFPYLPTYIANTAGAYYYFGNEKYNLSRPDAYNTNLKWEQTTTWNAGLDFGFWNGRLSGSFDFYYRETEDLINSVSVSAGSNFKNKVLSNVGTMNNKGVEFSVNYKPIVSSDWIWDLGFNITYNKNEITKLTTGTGEGYYVPVGGISAGTGGNAQAHKVGYPAFSYYVYQQVYDDKGNPIENLFVDRNSDGVINDNDKYAYKKKDGDVLMGLTSKLSYKAWDFSFSLRATLNNYVYNDALADNANVSSSGIWSTSGFFSNRSKNAINLGWKGIGNYAFSDYFVQNASYLKCDNITVGYSFKNLFGAKIEGRTYLTAQNVFTVTNYKGLDPEVENGIDNNFYPRPFIGVFGLTLNF